jgi:hypothetical protein
MTKSDISVKYSNLSNLLKTTKSDESTWETPANVSLSLFFVFLLALATCAAQHTYP